MELSQSLKEYDIVGIGVSTLDLLTIVREFSSQESVQKATDAKFQGGGPVATALAAAARIGAKVVMLDSLGDDPIAESIIKEFKQFGVITKHISITPDTTSSIASIWIRERDGKRAIAYSPGTSPELEAERLPIEIIKQAKIIHTNGRHLKCCLKACKIARKSGIKTSFDGGKGRYRSELDELIPLIDICIVARDFAEKYAKTSHIESAAETMLNQGCEVVVITDGENGSFIFSKHGEEFHQPAFLVEKVVDTTGCGDVYHGIFLFSLASGLTLKESATRASAAAAINAQYIGGRGMIPTFEALMDFIQARKSCFTEVNSC